MISGRLNNKNCIIYNNDNNNCHRNAEINDDDNDSNNKNIWQMNTINNENNNNIRVTTNKPINTMN